MTRPPSRFNGSVGSEGTLRVASGNAVHSSSRPSASDRGAAGLESPMLVDEAVTRGADALGMAGGDGSLAVVAAAARHTRFPSSAFPPALATTSRSISASTAMTWSVRSTRSPRESSASSTWRR